MIITIELMQGVCVFVLVCHITLGTQNKQMYQNYKSAYALRPKDHDQTGGTDCISLALVIVFSINIQSAGLAAERQRVYEKTISPPPTLFISICPLMNYFTCSTIAPFIFHVLLSWILTSRN